MSMDALNCNLAHPAVLSWLLYQIKHTIIAQARLGKCGRNGLRDMRPYSSLCWL